MLAEVLAVVAMMTSEYEVKMPPVVYSNNPNYINSSEDLSSMTCRKHYYPNGDMALKCKIYINTCYRSRSTTALQLSKVVLHEMAHYVDINENGEASGHSGRWQEVMSNWGQPQTSDIQTKDMPKSCRRVVEPPEEAQSDNIILYTKRGRVIPEF